MSFSFIFKTGRQALDAVSETYAPSKTASTSRIRKNGLICMGIGALCFLAAGSFMFILPQSSIVMFPILFGYAFMIVGAYRVVMGKNPEPAYPGEVSVQRIFFGVGTIVFVHWTLMGLVYLGEFLYTFLKKNF